MQVDTLLTVNLLSWFWTVGLSVKVANTTNVVNFHTKVRVPTLTMKIYNTCCAKKNISKFYCILFSFKLSCWQKSVDPRYPNSLIGGSKPYIMEYDIFLEQNIEIYLFIFIFQKNYHKNTNTDSYYLYGIPTKQCILTSVSFERSSTMSL